MTSSTIGNPEFQDPISLGTWARYAAALAFLLLLHTLFLSRIHRDWWFEDDPNIVFFVRDNPHPVDYFTDRDVLLRLSPNRIFTPMQALSFRLDARIGGERPAVFYGHTLLVLLFTLCLLWKVLARFFEPRAALIACALWLLLPSTLAVVEFLSARHYLEGLTWMLASLLLAFRYLDTPPRRAWLPLAGALAFYFLAAVSKEVFVTSGFWLLLCFFLRAQRRGGVIAGSTVFLVYFLYRGWAIGLIGQGFDESWRSITSYPLFLARFPHILTGNDGGYLLLALLLGILVWLLRQDESPARAFFFWFSQLGVVLLTIFPVTVHLSAAYLEHGTWYRAAFLLNTLVLVMGLWLVTASGQPRMRRIAAVLTLLLVARGGWTAARQWDARKADYRADGEFYRDHPGRLLYTELPAFYMTGIHNLGHRYQPRHFIAAMEKSTEVLDCLGRAQTVWRRTAVGYREDAELFRRIGFNHAHGIVPLHLAVDEENLPPAGPAGPIARIRAEGDRLLITRSLGGRPLASAAIALDGPALRVWYLVFPIAAEAETAARLWFKPTHNLAGQPMPISISARDAAGGLITAWEVRIGAGSLGEIPLAQHLGTDGQSELALLELRGEQSFRVLGSRVPEPFLALLVEPLTPVSADTAYFSHIPANRRAFHTLLGFYNPSEEAREFELELLWADAPATRMPIHLAPHQTSRFHPRDEGGRAEVPVAAIARSVAELVPFQVLRRISEPDAVVFPPVQELSHSLRLLNPAVTVENGYQNFAFLNPNPDTACLRLLDDRGNTLDTRKVAANGKLALSMKVFSHRSISRVQSDQPIAGLVVYVTAWGQMAVQNLVPAEPGPP